MLDQRLSLRYQPIVAAHSGRLVAVEALLRRGEERAAPLRLLKAAAARGASEQIDRFVVRDACAQLCRWMAVRLHVPVHVNVSTETAVKANGAGFAAWLSGLALPHGSLAVELTETTRIRAPDALAAFVTACRGASVEVAIDDFGCGYSTLALLQKVRADIVKIDRRFVAALPHDARTRSIVRHMIALAHDLGMRTVGEGVESAEHANWLRELGCDELQGYGIGLPMTGDELARWSRSDAVTPAPRDCATG